MSRATVISMELNGRNDSSTSTSSTTTRTRAREVMAFAARNGLKPTPMMEDWVEKLLKMGRIEHEVLNEVVIETMYAPYPSWRYFAAIVRQLLKEQPLTCYTLQDWEARKERWNSGY